jgi:hypothetical protein
MSRAAFPELEVDSEAFITAVERRLSAGRGLRRAVPGGWLHMDRPLPFLCAYRHPDTEAVQGAERLVLSQASHLSVVDAPELAPAVSALVASLGRLLSGRFGSFLVIEVWPVPGSGIFRIHAPATEPASTVAALADALKHVDLLGGPAETETLDDPEPAPPGRRALLTSDEQRASGVLLIGLEVPGFFLDAGGRPLAERCNRPRSSSPRCRRTCGPSTSGPSGPAGSSMRPARPTGAWPRSPSGSTTCWRSRR